MNAQPPVPERTLPPASAERIRAALMADRDVADREVLDDDVVRVRRPWLLPLAAALVVIALMATAVVLWPSADRTEVAATPSAAEVSWTPAPFDPGPPFGTVPTMWASADPTSGPTSSTGVFRTDRGPLSPSEVDAAVTWCAGEVGSPGDGAVSRYARRVTNGQEDLVVLVVQQPDGSTLSCSGRGGGLLYEDLAGSGPTDRDPVVVFDVGQGLGRHGSTSDFQYLALPGVARVQARALVKGEPQPWFEAEVHAGLAYLPVFTPGRFTMLANKKSPRGIRYEHRAYGVDGQELPVKVVQR